MEENSPFIYSCSNYKTIILLSYLMNDANATILFPEDDRDTRATSTRDIFMKWTCRDNRRYLKYPNFFNREIRKFRDDTQKRFLAIPILMAYPSHCKGEVSPHHLSIALYDKAYKRLEYFDSSFTTCRRTDSYDTTQVVDTLVKLLVYHFGLRIHNVVDPITFCIKSNDGIYRGVQRLQEKELKEIRYGENAGFCSLYTLRFIDYRLKNPDVHGSDIMAAMTKRGRLTKIIQDYAKKMETIRQLLEKEVRKRVSYDTVQMIHKLPENVDNETKIHVMLQFFRCLKEINIKRRIAKAPPSSPTSEE